MGNGSGASDRNGVLFWNYPGGQLDFEVDGPNGLDRVAGNTLVTGRWYYLTGTWDGSTVSLYENGALVASTAQTLDASPAYDLTLGVDGALSYSGDYLNGSLDEARVSGIARSADWVATEYANQSSPSTFFALSSEATTGIAPAAVALYVNQSQQFAAPGLCSAGVTWSLSSDTEGTLTPSGLYTSPTSITVQQTVTVTATSQANSGQSASATVTLLPAVSVTVSPASITLNQNQSQQFTATVNNSLSQAVTWTMSPAGLGSLDQTGAYIAPSSITTQQTVTVTATSQTDSTKSASAMITLAPSTCASAGFGYQRVIVIDHAKVANTDQVNYPFLFNSIDPDLATVDNGGHVISPNGSDIIFSSDPNGRTRLDFEVEQYNPATGQLVAWIRIPTLSHADDTVIYVFYGNPAITASQANPSGVWDSNYEAVYHFGNLPSTEIASDSTNYANDAPLSNLYRYPGQIDGAASLNGVNSYLQIPATAFPNYPTGVQSNIGVNTYWNNMSFDATFGIWFKTASWGGLLDQTSGYYCTSWDLFCGPEQPGTNPDGGWAEMLAVNFNGNLEGDFIGASTQTYNDNNWHYATISYENGVNKLYADGQLVATSSSGTIGYSVNYAYFVGAENIETDNSSLDSRPWRYLNGEIDEITVSNTARSGDWIQTQYNNQSSPSTFYTFYSPAAIQVAPSSISLYASQSEQFTVPGTCDATISWSLPGNSLGTLTTSGLYTAPSAISSRQTVSVSATSLSNSASLGTAQVTLLPPPQPLTLIASSPSPYQVGSSQTFTATLLDPQGNPRIGVTVNFTVAGVNATVGSAATATNGIASFSYTGSNTGTDTVQATASVDGALLASNSLTAAWLTPPPESVPTVTLLPQPSPGRGALMGAFTDNNGNLIEPIVIGTAARTFITPAGATQLQLGVDDNYYQDNAGAGFVVAVNGVNVTVPPTAQPWNWQTGGLNNNYQFGINDGSNPKVGAANLTAGQPVIVAYQSGTVTTDTPLRPLVDANGETDFTTGTQVWQGAYFPTLYTTGTAYPQSQPINVFAVVTDATGTPIPNVPVTLSVAGANPGQYQAVSDATGTASFLYTGQYAGNDNLLVQAVLNGGGTLNSNQTTIDWTNYPTPPPVGSLSFNYIGIIVNSQYFTSFARDASGNPLPNVNIGFYVTGVDNFQSSSSTNDIGQVEYSYYHTQSGNYSIFAVDSVDRNVIVTPAYTAYWQVPSGTPVASGGTIGISITASQYDTLGTPLQLSGTVTDSAGLTTTETWAKVSGPGTVTFADPTNPVTTAAFSQAGTYVLELFATDSVNSGWEQISVTVITPSVASVSQGWIGSPLYGSQVSGLVPVTLAPGVVLQSGTLIYYPASNPSNITPLPITAESDTIATLDTTTLPNGSYWISLQATDTNGDQQYALVLVTVVGNYKPGRVTATVTDLVVPATGLAINIQRTYDSLNAGTSGDFGYGWNLGINVNLVVDNAGNVTFTLGGQRKTFYLTPTMPPCVAFVGCLFPYNFVAYTPEPGLYGTLTDGGSGCGDTLAILVRDGSIWYCQGGNQYIPTSYIYTDPNGTSYTISAAGNLQSIQDRSGNGLTITPNGITSSTGLNVPFVRDSSNRITQITDPQGNIYSYGYDANGNLATVTYPATSQSTACQNTSAPNMSTYSYNSNHYYLSGTDGRCNPLPVTAYYDSSTDGGNSSLDGRLLSVTDSSNNTTSYAYILSTTSTINGVSVPNTGVTTISYPDSGTAAMIYDSYGMLLSSQDPNGNTTINAYDANHNLISTTDPLGHTTASTYDANGNKTSTTYPSTGAGHNTTSYTYYNQYSEPVSKTDELGNVRTFNYDANYNPQSVTDTISGQTSVVISSLYNSNGQLLAAAAGTDITAQPASASTFTYDANGNMISATNALGRTTTFTYDSLGNRLSVTMPSTQSATSKRAAEVKRAGTSFRALDTPPSSSASTTTTYTYDARYNLLTISEPLGQSAVYNYDANGNLTSVVDPNGNTYSYTYDSLNRVIEVDLPTGTSYTFTYDFRNNVVNAKDPEGHIRHNVYDLAGRLISATYGLGTPDGATTSFTYDSDGHTQTATDPLGHTTNYTYDAAGNLLSVQRGSSAVQYAYDDARNRISQTDANGNTTKFQYDDRSRLDSVTLADQTSESRRYDDAGNLISKTDQSGNVVQYTYDVANQLQSLIQMNHPSSSNNTITFGHDAAGNLTSWSDQNGHTTNTSFDQLNRLVSKTLPDGTLSEFAGYDFNNNLTSLTKYSGKTTNYTYDSLNRLSIQAPDPSVNEPTVSFTYTANGFPATMTDGSGTTSYTYDNLDRLITKTTPEGTLHYTYDAAGNVTSMSSSDQRVTVNYTYDELNRLTTVVDNSLPSGQNTTTYFYDPASNVATATYPNGLQSTFTYDQLNRLSQLVTPVSGYSYQRDLSGNLTSASESNGRTVGWSYDGVYQLTNETINGDSSQENGTVSYNLDPVGNRFSQTSTVNAIPSAANTYDADDRMQSEGYDPNGDVLQTAGKLYFYDSYSRLTSMNGGAVTILYDGQGNRVAKSVNGVVTRYLVDDLSPTGYPQVVEELVNGAATRQYTYGLQRISENQVVHGAWTPSFYEYDGGGNVRLLTNAAGQVTDTYDYDAFGNEISHSGTTPNDYLYRGEQWDPGLSLYYLRARYYNPVTGRFLSQDPYAGDKYDPPSLHRYRYARGNPSSYIDPSGRGAIADYAFNLGLKYGPEVTAVAQLGAEIVCVYYAEASAIELVNRWMELGMMQRGIGITSLALQIYSCKAIAEFTEEPGFEGEPAEPGPCCFAAGTPIHTDHGNVPMEKIAVGDRVYSRNRQTGKTELRPVTALTPPHRDKLLELRIEGETALLRPSLEHPFWVKRGAAEPGHWIEAANLVAGELLETIGGKWLKIISVTPVEGQETVYNFTVDKNHDYFVGETGFLVHNAGGCGCRPTYLYAMNGGDGGFLKWGISYNPARRYTQRFLNSFGGSLDVLMSGSRQDMLDMERTLAERYPGPLNKEPWAGCNIP